ncbi:SpoIIE family protein phosphatase [Streptomyces cinereoruber]|uniref:SpoIIE family protein phosphatase n=1 Tax=Streptomyces cinereoruber TaxID=67260 RepID=UPI003BF4F3BD
MLPPVAKTREKPPFPHPFRDQAVTGLIELNAQLPLGMFEDTVYTTEHFRTEPGGRLVAVSDGVYDVTSPSGERYSERALARALNSTRLLPASRVPRAVLQELAGHRGVIDADDGAMVVCLDRRGRTSD